MIDGSLNPHCALCGRMLWSGTVMAPFCNGCINTVFAVLAIVSSVILVLASIFI